MGDYEDILYTKVGGRADIVLNRPEVLNALRTQTYEELTSAFNDAADDAAVGVITLSGAGGRAFSSGGDVRAQRGRTEDLGRLHFRRLLTLASAMRNNGKPTIAVVDGYAIGAGNELQVMCDLAIASSRSVFGQVGPRVGSVPVWGATQLLPRLVGERKAREMIFLCRRYSADEAQTMGLINRVVDHEELAAEVDAWCEEILDLSPSSLRIAKTSLNSESDLLWSSFVHGGQLLCATYGKEETLEGVTAFLERRAPDFRKYRV
jgi:dihydroxynaphthoic acid synthetase